MEIVFVIFETAFKKDLILAKHPLKNMKKKNTQTVASILTMRLYILHILRYSCYFDALNWKCL